jgi:hypothetical protein
MVWATLTVKKNQKFGDLKVIEDDTNGRSGWVVCVCWCGNRRVVLERRLLDGEITACEGCTARMKMEKQTQK